MTAVLPYVRVSGAQVIDDYVLELTFEDGTIGRVSFAGREWKGVFEPFRDPATFAEVYVDPQFGTIAWPNGLDMAPEPLYQEALRHPARRTARAQ
jgi:Protein of unknown function (DUF2442)